MYGKKAHHRSNLYLLYIITFLCAQVFGRINDGVSESSESINDISNLRYLAFGSSMTWGSGVQDRSNAYPYLLSSKATNLALRATGPNYPSICTQSMVGDEIYDVIMLEYFSRASDGLKPLAERLRQRFPNAMIILVQLWNPKMISYRKNIHINKWVSEKKLPLNDPKLLEAVEATSSSEWTFNMEWMRFCMNILEDTAKAVNGYILKGPPFPIENYEKIDVKNLLLSTRSMFSDDWFHLSEEGHRVVAQAVKDFLQTIPVKRSDEVGTWGKGDLCHKWYESGKVDIPFSDGVTMNQYKPGKYALQFPSTGGTLKISNPFEEPRALTACYLTTGPAPSIYPKTEMKINNSQSQSVTIDPVCNDFDFPVHVLSCKKIGMVDPGESILSIAPLETTQQPFRALGVALTNGDEQMSNNFVGDVN